MPRTPVVARGNTASGDARPEGFPLVQTNPTIVIAHCQFNVRP
jgi:hypothetical protein